MSSLRRAYPLLFLLLGTSYYGFAQDSPAVDSRLPAVAMPDSYAIVITDDSVVVVDSLTYYLVAAATKKWLAYFDSAETSYRVELHTLRDEVDALQVALDQYTDSCNETVADLNRRIISAKAIGQAQMDEIARSEAIIDSLSLLTQTDTTAYRILDSFYYILDEWKGR